MKKKSVTVVALSLPGMIMSMVALPAFPHGDEAHGKSKVASPPIVEEYVFGRQGSDEKADRTIVIDMSDRMRFNPGEIIVRQGETIRFTVMNSGKMMHEMVIGTMDELKRHHEMMKRHPGMEHEESYMAHVAPGKKQEIVWQFTQPGEFYYACLIAGHFEAGMIGKIKVLKG